MAAIRVAQYIARELADRGVRQVFMLTGGGAMFLNDALSFEGRIQAVYCHHEQACAMAAEGYARVSGRPGVVNVTTGPGAINALNGVFGAYTDSIPMLVISGQVKRSTHLRSTPVPGLRQLGDQEVDIIGLAQGICKSAYSLLDPADTPIVLMQAWHDCQSGRPGPVWIDIPIDVQSAMIDPPSRAPDVPYATADEATQRRLRECASALVDEIESARRPLFLWGTGVRLAGCHLELLALARRLQVPVATAWTHDTIASDDPLFAGRPGTIGTRVGNFVLQAADLVVVFGSRLNIRQISYNFESFARSARLIHIDIDEAELRKPLRRPDVAVVADLRHFAPMLLQLAQQRPVQAARQAWLGWIAERRRAFPLVAPHLRALRDERINPYWFIETLFGLLRDDDVVATGNASACIIPFQIAPIRGTMRLFSNSGSASMGYDLPAAIGAAFAAEGRRVICLAGDGSLQLNVQELQTLAHYRLEVKVVVLENEGYLSIRSSQTNFFGRTAGESVESGLSLPDYVRVAHAYGLPAWRIRGASFATELRAALDIPGPGVIVAELDGRQGFEPRMSSRQLPDGSIVSPTLENMYPFLEPDDLAWAMDLSNSR